MNKKTNSLLPVPGGPHSKYPLRCGIPAFVYHDSLFKNSFASDTSDLMTPSCRMIELSGRRAFDFALDHVNTGPKFG